MISLRFWLRKKNNGVDERFLDDNLYMCLIVRKAEPTTISTEKDTTE